MPVGWGGGAKPREVLMESEHSVLLFLLCFYSSFPPKLQPLLCPSAKPNTLETTEPVWEPPPPL